QRSARSVSGASSIPTTTGRRPIMICLLSLTRAVRVWVAAACCSDPAPDALDFLVDLVLCELVAPPDVPGIHDDTDSPADDRKYRPEEPGGGHGPDRDQKGVDHHINQQVRPEVTAFLQPLHCLSRISCSRGSRVVIASSPLLGPVATPNVTAKH